MFQKRIIEVITLLVYCFIVTPLTYNYCKTKEIVRKIDTDDLLGTLYENCTFILCAMIGYVIYYRIIMFSYMKLKVFDIRMWKKVKEAKKDPESFFEKKSCNKSFSKEVPKVLESGEKKSKQVTRKMKRTISNPLATETDLARIHIKHEKKSVESVTLPRILQVQVHSSQYTSLRRAPPPPHMKESASLPKNLIKGHKMVTSKVLSSA